MAAALRESERYVTWRDQDITYYFNQNRIRDEELELRPIGDTIMETIESLKREQQRWPVRNREPRTPISSLVRALIYGRDGDSCRVCGKGGMMTVDHIIPRSAFCVEDLRIADRSDNLTNLCWGCNERKSNYFRDFSKRLGVVARCGWCTAGHNIAIHDCDEFCPSWGDLYGSQPTIPVYCGQCGHGASVPSLSWVL